MTGDGKNTSLWLDLIFCADGIIWSAVTVLESPVSGLQQGGQQNIS